MRGPRGAAGAEAYRFFCVAGAAGSTLARFIPLLGVAAQASEITAFRQVPRAATLTTLRVYLTTPYVTANATIALRLNGVDTALVGVISAGGQVLTVTGVVAVAAGNTLSVRIQLDAAETNATLGISVVAY